MSPEAPVPAFTGEETEKKNEYLTTLKKAGKEFSVKYILGDSSWDEWVKKAKSLGCDDLTDIYNNAQKRLSGK